MGSVYRAVRVVLHAVVPRVLHALVEITHARHALVARVGHIAVRRARRVTAQGEGNPNTPAPHPFS